jgi:hypothetical protein
MPRAPTSSGDIHGRIMDQTTGKPIARASLSVRLAKDSSFAGGALADADGQFRADGIGFGAYYLRVRALGYLPQTIDHVVIGPSAPSISMGNITLQVAVHTLGEQVISADRLASELTPDRNSYSTKDMAVPGGGTALDVLRSTPAVDVDAANVVTLRGSPNVVVQINGRASPLHGEQLGQFLQQLPASTVANRGSDKSLCEIRSGRHGGHHQSCSQTGS